VNSIIWPNPEFDNNITVYGPEVKALVTRYLKQMMGELATLPNPNGGGGALMLWDVKTAKAKIVLAGQIFNTGPPVFAENGKMLSIAKELGFPLRAKKGGVLRRTGHTEATVDLARLAGRDVVVVGGGQSALETAALLYEQGAFPQVLVRQPLLSWNEVPQSYPRSFRRRLRAPIAGLGAGWQNWLYSELPPAFHLLSATTRARLVRETLGPAGAWWLKDRVQDQVPVLQGCSIAAADSLADGRVRLRLSVAGGPGPELVADHVIAATGYRVTADRLSFLAPDLRARLRRIDGAPALSRSFESSEPGLFFIGIAAANSFGPVMRFVFGTGFAARTVARRLGRSAPPAAARTFLLPRPRSRGAELSPPRRMANRSG
jgi:hypothetical protein